MSQNARLIIILSTILSLVCMVVLLVAWRLVASPLRVALSGTPTPAATVPWPTPRPTWTPQTPQALRTPRPTQGIPPTPTTTPRPTLTPLPTPSWTQLGFLQSGEYEVTTVVEEKVPQNPILDFLLGIEQLHIIAVGKVPVGVDINRAKFTVTDRTTLEVKLPPATVRDAALLPHRTEIIAKNARLRLVDNPRVMEQLSGALTQAKTKMELEVAQNERMMKLAQDSAELQITKFFRELGYDKVKVTFEKEQ